MGESMGTGVGVLSIWDSCRWKWVLTTIIEGVCGCCVSACVCVCGWVCGCGCGPVLGVMGVRRGVARVERRRARTGGVCSQKRLEMQQVGRCMSVCESVNEVIM